MNGRLPGLARRILDRGILCYVAVRTPAGPHLTPVVYALDAGRLWLTTARRSVKARAWRRDPEVAGMVRSEAGALVFRGRVRTYDVLDPESWPHAALAGPRIVRAATRFGLKNARFFAGYAVDAPRVPLAWAPPGRVFVEVRLRAGRVLVRDPGGAASIAEGWGPWEVGAASVRSFAELRRRRGVDRLVPPDVRRAALAAPVAALAVQWEDAVTALPALWTRRAAQGAYEAVLPTVWLDLAGTGPDPVGALTLDHPDAWRAAEMTGMLVQGPARVFVPSEVRRGRETLARRIGVAAGPGAPEDQALVRIRPARAVWWKGWASATVIARGGPAKRGRPKRPGGAVER